MLSHRLWIGAALEMASVAAEAKQPITGVIWVELREEDDLGAVAIQIETLGESQLRRFERPGNFSHIENAISYMAIAVGLTDDRHPDKPAYLSNFGNAQQARFKCLGDV